jgi:hypothetical protein
VRRREHRGLSLDHAGTVDVAVTPTAGRAGGPGGSCEPLLRTLVAMALRVVVVQHGDKERLPGDPGLTELGKRQALTTARWLRVRPSTTLARHTVRP